MTNLGELRGRFERAAAAAGAAGSSGAVFADLVARYGEAHRHYHTLAHVDACLGWLDWFAGLAEHPEEIELALWFHDAIYELNGGGNEQGSAELARSQLSALGVAPDAIDRIAGHILATEGHRASNADGRLVVDLDLSILGARPRQFAAFERQIRREYANVPEAAYRAGRSLVLSDFVSRPRIYGTPALGAELEARARLNLSRRLAELESNAAASGM